MNKIFLPVCLQSTGHDVNACSSVREGYGKELWDLTQQNHSKLMSYSRLDK